MHLLVALGLVMLTAGFFAIRGYFVRDSFYVERAWIDGSRYVREVWGIHAARGMFILHYLQTSNSTKVIRGPLGWRVRHEAEPSGTAPRRGDSILNRLGFWFFRSIISPELIAAVPSWFVVLPLVALTCVQVRRTVRTRTSRREGLCASCGYDLRGAPHERCPECGEPVAGAARV